MSLVRRDGRLLKQHWVTGIDGTHEAWIDCGPAPPLSRADRALLAMQRMERRFQTGRRLYGVASRIAIAEIFHNFH